MDCVQGTGEGTGNEMWALFLKAHGWGVRREGEGCSVGPQERHGPRVREPGGLPGGGDATP